MELLTVTEEEIKRLTPHQLITLNAALCSSMVEQVTPTSLILKAKSKVPQSCSEKIEEFLRVSEGDYYSLLAITSKLIFDSFDFLGLLAIAKDFISQAKQNQSYYDLLKSEHYRDYDVTLTDAQRACDDYSDDFQNWLLSSR